jgi:mono/diheme cytochrome c family protein
MTATFKRITIRGLLAAGTINLSSLLSQAAWAETAGGWKNGTEVYAKVCGYCHQRGIGPVIRGRELPPEYITHVVRHGLRAMPAFAASFIDDQALREASDYISKSAADREQGAENGH